MATSSGNSVGYLITMQFSCARRVTVEQRSNGRSPGIDRASVRVRESRGEEFTAMLRKLKDLEHWAVLSREGDDLGAVQDFHFDDERWTVRYVVMKAGRWFTGRLVWLSPMSLDHVQWDQAVVVFGLTREQIESAPDADLTMPVSRRWEAAYAGYYAIPYYWSGTGIWGDWPTPFEARLALRGPAPAPSADGEHLRSTRAVTGYHLQAADGEIGQVDDFLVDDRTWTIRYLLIDTSNRIGGRAVLIPPGRAGQVDWQRRLVHVALTRQQIEDSREYDPAADIGGVYRIDLANAEDQPVRHW
jgi:sporulation protein YlmC with PRC-barrel domain